MDTGYTAEQFGQWQKEAGAYTDIAKETPELAAARQASAAQVQQSGNRAAMMQQLEQGRLAKQMARAAYARGYNPAALRQAQEAMAEQQSDIAGRVNQIAREDADRATQAYAQILQQRQKMQFAAQEARSAYIMGNQKIALQSLDNARRAEIASKGLAMQEAQAKADASARMTSALIGAGSTLGASWATRPHSPSVTPIENLGTPQAGQPIIPQSGPLPSMFDNQMQRANA